MENLGTAKVTPFEVSKMSYIRIKNIFGNYIFSRKDTEGKYFVMADKKQQEIIKSKGMKLTQVEL